MQVKRIAFKRFTEQHKRREKKTSIARTVRKTIDQLA